MNKHKHAKEIHAYADGAEIQYYSNFSLKWVDCISEPQWERDTKYRVKPREPRVRYLNLCVGSLDIAHPTADAAKANSYKKSTLETAVKFIEVLDDE